MTATCSRLARLPRRRWRRLVPFPPPRPLLLLLLLAALGPAHGWESGDLELFDLVEEVQLNFYKFLGVQQDASSADIRKAYRKLSLTLHPDKNKDENAETQFRQLVAIYEVLKDDERRQRYDDILINGLPDWRQPVFYYRRVRKMSNAELALLLFIILTVGHYAVVWSIYLEKQLDELLSRKKREKKKKTGSKSVDVSKLGASEKNERLLTKPQWHDLLPCKLGIWFCLTLKALPHLIQDAGEFYAKYKETRLQKKEDALTRAELETLQKQKKVKVKKPKPEFPVYMPLESAYIQSYDHGTSIEEIEEQMDDWLENRNKTQKKQAPEWTEEDLSQLTRSMVKFPGGTPGRWEKIAHELGRSVTDEWSDSLNSGLQLRIPGPPRPPRPCQMTSSPNETMQSRLRGRRTRRMSRRRTTMSRRQWSWKAGHGGEGQPGRLRPQQRWSQRRRSEERGRRTLIYQNKRNPAMRRARRKTELVLLRSHGLRVNRNFWN
ncbi:dnaJ homolog subfamily C member 1 isoform X2 [Neomonachus schauinslandi]|uniref:DnaJ homolog subfamily C member 1 isoform X2 n=1 Tax=Neomonachus schauinslandi TaxID=29088 RepID=A0A8M1MFW3_NEOSC|nr:dnaJ homolog subfamily C member 1 isoform X2 [Neomonachus schauinslandi]